MTHFVILVTGSRTWRWPRYLRSVLEETVETVPCQPVMIRHGAAGGADTLADNVAGFHGWERDPKPVHKSAWKALGGYAGHARNQHMVNLGADLCLAFLRDHSSGTRDCIDRAHAADIPVKVYYDCKCHTVSGEER